MKLPVENFETIAYVIIRMASYATGGGLFSMYSWNSFRVFVASLFCGKLIPSSMFQVIIPVKTIVMLNAAYN